MRPNKEQLKSLLRTLGATFGGMIAGYFSAKGWIDADTVTGILTSETFSQRMLGRSEMVSVPSSSLWLATGNNLVKGSPLTTNGTGRLVLATTGQRIVAFSEETYNNNTGSDQLVRVRPAKAIGAV